MKGKHLKEKFEKELFGDGEEQFDRDVGVSDRYYYVSESDESDEERQHIPLDLSNLVVFNEEDGNGY